MSDTFEALENRLKEGNARYMRNSDDKEARTDKEVRTKWKDTQEPKVIVLGCADSRVMPEHIFDMGVGEVFTVRVAGNIANTESIASIEYMVSATDDKKLIVVLGHEKCGAVVAARGAAQAGGKDYGHNLNMLLAQLTPAVTACGHDADLRDVVVKNASLVAEDLVNRSSIISDAVKSQKVKIVHAYYEFVEGKVTFRPE